VIARDSYRFVFSLESGASSAGESVTFPEDSGGPLVRKADVFPQRRPDRKYFTGQTARNRFRGPVEIVVHWEQTIRFEFPENASQFLLKSINGVEEISAIQVEFAAAQLPIGAEEKVIPEDKIRDLR
jgi:hypothetical protein